MNNLFNYNNETEQFIFNTVKYIEELITEFGIIHPLVDKSVKELIDYVQLSVDNNFQFSENFATGLTRYFEKFEARVDKDKKKQQNLEVLWEQHLLEEKPNSNESWLSSIFCCIFVFGIGAFLYQCFRKKDPVQILHHHSGSITDNININHSGYVTENINLRLNRF